MGMMTDRITLDNRQATAKFCREAAILQEMAKTKQGFVFLVLIISNVTDQVHVMGSRQILNKVELELQSLKSYYLDKVVEYLIFHIIML